MSKKCGDVDFNTECEKRDCKCNNCSEIGCELCPKYGCKKYPMNRYNGTEVVVGMKVKQIKSLGRYGFDHSEKEFEIVEVNQDSVIGRSGNLGFSISKEAFSEYFQVIVPEEPAIDDTFNLGEMVVVRKGTLTLVELPDGSRGASKCLPQDIYNYDMQKGLDIAFKKALIVFNRRILKEQKRVLRESEDAIRGLERELQKLCK